MPEYYAKELMEKLGVAANSVWGYSIMQIHHEAWCSALWAVAWLLIATGLFCLLWRHTEPLEANGEAVDAMVRRAWWCGAVIVGGFFLIISLACFSQAILMGMNPEYYAFHNILKSLTKTVPTN